MASTVALPINKAKVGEPAEVLRITTSLKKKEADSVSDGVSEAFKSLTLGSAGLVR